MEDHQNYYSILGVAVDAPEAEIRRAFRARAKAFHPDTNPGGVQGETYQDFGLLTEAYETLKDEKKREAYDQSLARSRHLTAGTGKRSSRAFAAGLVIGIAVAALAGGAKVYFDRMARLPKSQESL